MSANRMINADDSPDTSSADSSQPILTYRLKFDQSAFAKLSARDRQGYLWALNRMAELGYIGIHAAPSRELACIDLNEFDGFEDYVRRCRKVHKATAIRQALKAERNGYYSKFFNPKVFVGDIVAINTSAHERQGMPMSSHYLTSAEQRGGYPSRLEPELPPAQAYFWVRHFGTFRNLPGHKQGDLVVDEQLVAYGIGRRCGEFVSYTSLIGHADQVPEGVVYRLHLDFVKAVMAQRTAVAQGRDIDASLNGVRYFFHGAFYVTQPGLVTWKKRMGFHPGHFVFEEFDRATKIHETGSVMS